jgi:hypothetical protein
MVCLGNICINTLHKGAKYDDDDDDDNIIIIIIIIIIIYKHAIETNGMFSAQIALFLHKFYGANSSSKPALSVTHALQYAFINFSLAASRKLHRDQYHCRT